MTQAPSLPVRPVAANHDANAEPGPLEQTVAARDFSMLIALMAIVVYFAVATDGAFIGARNLSMLAIELSITAVLALGMLLVILPGHIDLSVGSGIGLLGGVASVLIFEHAWPAPAAMGVALVAGVCIWALMGTLIVKQRVPSFIITLGGLLIFRGLHWMVIHNSTIPVTTGSENLLSRLTTFYISPRVGIALAACVMALMGIAALRAHRARSSQRVAADGELAFMRWFVWSQLILLFVLSCNQHRGVPLSAAILGMVAFAVHVLTRLTPFGRYLYAIGGNEEAAFISGVPVQRVVIGAFVIMGAIVALTGLLQTAYAGASTTTVGTLSELDAVAACVIGGTTLRGGRGTVGGVLLGSLIMATLLNGMTLMAVSPEMKYLARGTVLALAVWVDVRLARR
jgi:D-xylose transport system permease protein